MSSFADSLYKAGAYYVNQGVTPGTEHEHQVPWKIEWDPSLGSDSYSREVIRIDLNAPTVSGQDPDTYERFFNPSVGMGVLPLRHSLFDGSPNHPITIWTLTIGGSAWIPVPNATGIEGIDASAAFFIRRDIPLSGDVGFTVGRQLFVGTEGINWTSVSHIMVEILYLGDYVQSKSFSQDLHHDANVTHRNLEVDFTSSTQFSYSDTLTSRLFKLYRGMDSSFIKGVSKDTNDDRSEVVLDDTHVQSIHVADPELRFGIHTTVYSSISPSNEGQAHAGSWPTGAEYFYIDKSQPSLNNSLRNFVISHLQQPRTDLAAIPVENAGEAVLQYDSSEGAWQIGSFEDNYKREYSEAPAPYLNRRYPIVARFVQGKATATNAGWTGPEGPNRALSDALDRNALVTTFRGDPSLLQVHPDTDFFVEESTGEIFLRGLTQLRLYAPGMDFSDGRMVTWSADSSLVSLLVGESDSRRVQTINETYIVSPSPTSVLNRTGIRWRLQSGATQPSYALQISPSNSDGVYAGTAFRNILSIGLREHGTLGTAKHVYLGLEDATGAYIDIPRDNVSSFDFIIASHVKTRVRGNMDVEGILDTYGDIALGRGRQSEGSYTDTFGRVALIRGSATQDKLELGRTTSGTMDVKSDSYFIRRVSGPTTFRIDSQLRSLLGLPLLPSPNVDEYRDVTTHEYQTQLIEFRDEVYPTTDITQGQAPLNRGKVDGWDSRYVEFTYNNGQVAITDFTSDVVRGYANEEDKAAGVHVTSGYVRGQLHRTGLTARGQYGEGLPVIMDRAGVPGENQVHAGQPLYVLNSSDMYLDADGVWRYLFDKVYLPVEMA